MFFKKLNQKYFFENHNKPDERLTDNIFRRINCQTRK
jgi:hypothetical protein